MERHAQRKQCPVRAPLTEIAHKALLVTQARATAQGLDFLEELNRVGLIATEPRIREIQVSALRNMLERLEMLSVDDLTRSARTNNSNPVTPAALYVSVLSWVSNYITHIETAD
jgi:hypothetical protein